MNSILDEAGFELRSKVGPVLRLGLALVGIFLLLGTVGGVVAFFMFQNVRPPQDATDTRIPITAYGYAAVQVFDCVRQGPEKCEQYEQSQDYLRMSTMAGGIEYQPLKETDPGATNPGGTKTVEFTEQSTDADYMAFGEAVTLGGKISPTTVFETSFMDGTVERSAVFTYTDPKTDKQVHGTYVFSLTSQQMVVKSVRYEGAV